MIPNHNKWGHSHRESGGNSVQEVMFNRGELTWISRGATWH